MLRIPLGRRPQYMLQPSLRHSMRSQGQGPRPGTNVPRQPSRASEGGPVGRGGLAANSNTPQRASQHPVPGTIPTVPTVPSTHTSHNTYRHHCTRCGESSTGQRESHLDRQYRRRRRRRFRCQIGFGSCPRYTRSGRTRAHNSAGTGLRIGPSRYRRPERILTTRRYGRYHMAGSS